MEVIKEAENYVTLQTNQEQVGEENMSKIVSDLDLIKNTLTNNRMQIVKVKTVIKKEMLKKVMLRKAIPKTGIQKQATSIRFSNCPANNKLLLPVE